MRRAAVGAISGWEREGQGTAVGEGEGREGLGKLVRSGEGGGGDGGSGGGSDTPAEWTVPSPVPTTAARTDDDHA